MRRNTWTFLPAKTAFEGYRGRWDELNTLAGAHPLLDSAFVGPLVRHFASTRTLLGWSTDPEYPGMVLLEPHKPGFWATFQPSQAPLGLILLINRRDVGRQVNDLLRALPGYALALAVLHQDPAWSPLSDLPPSDTVERLAHMQTARLVVTGSFEEFWRARSKSLRGNLARSRRRLADSGGRLELRGVEDPAAIPRCIREYARFEQSGWKGRAGTAVGADDAQGHFYRDVLEDFCRRGEGVVYQLLANGRPIAFDVSLKRNGMLVSLKKTYDETMKQYSPGVLLTEDILRAAFCSQEVKLVEFYGRLADAHRHWTNDFRTIFHLNVYRHSLVPAARRLVHFIPLLKRPKAS